MAELRHYSARPLKLRSVEQDVFPSYKPRGLWLSVGSAWKDWGDDEQFSIDDEYVELELTESANVLILSTAEELDAFTEKYGCSSLVYGISDHYAIDWPKVANQYQGVIIAPYIYSRRLKLMWYYGWDCASGCIWDANAIRVVSSERKQAVRGNT